MGLALLVGEGEGGLDKGKIGGGKSGGRDIGLTGLDKDDALVEVEVGPNKLLKSSIADVTAETGLGFDNDIIAVDVIVLDRVGGAKGGGARAGGGGTSASLGLIFALDNDPRRSTSSSSSCALGTISDRKSSSLVDNAIELRGLVELERISLFVLENLFQNRETAEGGTGTTEGSVTEIVEDDSVETVVDCATTLGMAGGRTTFTTLVDASGVALPDWLERLTSLLVLSAGVLVSDDLFEEGDPILSGG